MPDNVGFPPRTGFPIEHICFAFSPEELQRMEESRRENLSVRERELKRRLAEADLPSPEKVTENYGVPHV